MACLWFISQPIMFSAGAVTDRGVKMIYVNRFPCMERASSKVKWGSAMQAACTLLCGPRGYTASQGNNFFRTIMRLARESPALRVVSDQVGAPTSARSIAEAIATLLPSDVNDIREAFSKADSMVHIANSGWTSWCGFATEIVNGLRDRNVGLKAIEVVPIQSSDFPTRAVRPLNSRLDLTRAANSFGLCMPSWQDALARELDDFVQSEQAR